MNTTLTWKEIYSLWITDRMVEGRRKNCAGVWTPIAPGSELRDDFEYRESQTWYVYEGCLEIFDHKIDQNEADPRKLLFSGTKSQCQEFFESIKSTWVQEPDMEKAIDIYIQHFPNWRNWFESEIEDTRDAWKQGVAWARSHGIE